MPTCKLSIVSTVYRSQETIEEFCQRAEKCAQKLVNQNYEIIIIDDGSPDDSSDCVRALIKKNKKINLVSLSRNFGHHNALLAGLEKSSGEMVFLIDSDLEEKPEWLLDFYDCYNSGDIDVVYGKQSKRKGRVLERLLGSIWYTILGWLVGNRSFFMNQVTARLMSREYVDAVISHPEKTTVISALYWLSGFRQQEFEVKKLSISASSYTLGKKLGYVTATIVGITNKPLYIMLGLNFVVALATAFGSIYLVFDQLARSSRIEGWASLALMSTTSFLLLSSCLIVIGLYVAQINTEVKNRPRYIETKEKKRKKT